MLSLWACNRGQNCQAGNKVTADRQVKGRKTIYSGGRKWTHGYHPYRRNLDFNGKVELHSPPTPMTGEETARCGIEWQEFQRNGGQENSKEDPVHKHGVQRQSCLDELPYCRVSVFQILNIVLYKGGCVSYWSLRKQVQMNS
jgi:hypothetical protein